MGYDLHITRKPHWFDEEGPVITLAEWAAFVARSPDLAPTDKDDPACEDFRLRVADEERPLWWNSPGEIVTKNPDGPIIRRLVSIAAGLHARVLGDDDEVYGLDPRDPIKAQAQ